MIPACLLLRASFVAQLLVAHQPSSTLLCTCNCWVNGLTCNLLIHIQRQLTRLVNAVAILIRHLVKVGFEVWSQQPCCLLSCLLPLPAAAGRDLDLQQLYRQVTGLGGAIAVTVDNKWTVGGPVQKRLQEPPVLCKSVRPAPLACDVVTVKAAMMETMQVGTEILLLILFTPSAFCALQCR
jgi:hypothetical protein